VRDEGDSVNNKRHKQHPQRRRLPIVKTLLGLVLATAETHLSDPPGFFFAAMPNEGTPQGAASKKKFQAASGQN
jgi:hypothetical protein